MSATKKLNPRIQGIWSFLMFLDTFRIQKCLETGKRQNPLKSHYFKGLLFLVGSVSEGTDFGQICN